MWGWGRVDIDNMFVHLTNVSIQKHGVSKGGVVGGGVVVVGVAMG